MIQSLIEANPDFPLEEAPELEACLNPFSILKGAPKKIKTSRLPVDSLLHDVINSASEASLKVAFPASEEGEKTLFRATPMSQVLQI